MLRTPGSQAPMQFSYLKAFIYTKEHIRHLSHETGSKFRNRKQSFPPHHNIKLHPNLSLNQKSRISAGLKWARQDAEFTPTTCNQPLSGKPVYSVKQRPLCPSRLGKLENFIYWVNYVHSVHAICTQTASKKAFVKGHPIFPRTGCAESLKDNSFAFLSSMFLVLITQTATTLIQCI